MAQRKQYTAQFKAKVAIEAIAGHRTINEIASTYGVHPTQVACWKKEVLERLPEAFSNNKRSIDKESDATIARLYQQIGQLTIELEYLKKKSGLCR
jgi:transposase-like protein